MDKIVRPGTVEGEVDPPSSKSYAQRCIAAAALAHGVSILRGVETCDDTEAALRVVQVLGAKVSNPAPGTWAIEGGFPLGLQAEGTHDKVGESDSNTLSATILDIGESGLSTRLFTPIASLSAHPVTITGHGSILARPMDMMLSPLRDLGVTITDNHGRLPITVRGPMRGGEAWVDGSVSSQFLTGLLVALPLAERDTTIRVTELKSIPYIDMTIDVMDHFGVDVDHRDYEEFYIPGSQEYTPVNMRIEGDWSAASCLLVAGAVASYWDSAEAGEADNVVRGVVVRNLNPTSLQADVAIIEALSRAGARIEQTADTVRVSRRGLVAFEFDATDCPDLFPALAALAAACEGTSRITGTRRLTHKECNRAEAIHSEYAKLGIEVDISEDNVMRITGRGGVAISAIGGGSGVSTEGAPIVVESFRDHRMAMSLAVATLSAPASVLIRDAECVSKSYADFWVDFDNLWRHE